MYDSFKDEMLDYLQSLVSQYPTATIGIVGHSLGAALATLGAYDTKKRFPEIEM